MMWRVEHSIETTVTPVAIWRQWADVARWPEWNGDIERIELHGPFAGGSRITMTPIGQDPIELRISEVAEPELFVDEAELGDIVVRTIHCAERPVSNGNQPLRGGHAWARGRTANQWRLPAGTGRARRSR